MFPPFLRLGFSSYQGAFTLLIREVLTLDEQTQKILAGILDYANAGQHIEFRLLDSWQVYRSIQQKRKIAKRLVKNLRFTHKLLFKKYCAEIPEHTTQLTKLLVCNTIKNAADFYTEELKTLTDMAEEYECYLLSGNFLDFIFYGERPEHKMKDYR
jgi:hypothetical protein